jgi:hypothetical protein
VLHSAYFDLEFPTIANAGKGVLCSPLLHTQHFPAEGSARW